MADVNIVVGIKGDDSGGRVIKRSLDDISQASKTAANSNQRLETQIRATSLAANGLSRAFAAMGAAFGVREIVRMADQYTVMEARLRSIAKTTQETTRMMGELRRISNVTGTEMSTSLAILQRLSFVREEIKATNNDMLAFTETVTKLGVTSGALPEAMKAGLTQLGQALSSQYTRAEEFNSIMENIPAVGKAIADQLGVTTGQLRLLVVEGKLLSSDVFAAILNQQLEINEQFSDMPKTAALGFAQMVNSFDQIIAQANSATGATNGIGMALVGVGDIAKRVYDGIATTFDFILASIQEGINAITKAFNLAIDGMNRLKSFIPGADATPMQRFETFGMGSRLSAAMDRSNARQSNLFGDLATGVTAEQREISKDYAKIAAGLSDKEGKKAADKAAREALKEQKKLQDQLTDAVKQSRTEEEKLYDQIKEMERLRGFATTAEQAEAITKNIKNARGELDKLRAEAELDSPTGKAFKRFWEGVDDSAQDAWRNAFSLDKQGSVFGRMLDGLKSMFVNFLTDLAYQAAIRPIVVSIAGSIGGSMGLSGNAISSVLGTGGSGGGIGIGNLLSAGKSFMNNGIGGQLGSFAGKTSAFLGGSFQQNVAVQKFFTNAGSFGNLAGGFAGGLAANLLGLGNKNGMVNGITGTLGGLAGSAFGPVGSAVGSFLGTALGGLFGGKKPSDKAQWGGIDLSTLGRFGMGGLGGKKFSAENANFRDSVLGEAGKLAQLIGSVGGRTSGQIFMTVGSRDGLRLGTGPTEQNFGNNQQAFINAVMQQVVRGTSGLNATMQKILSRTGTGNLNALSSNFEFGKWYDQLGKTSDPLADALKTLNDQFKAMIQTANNLGFPLDKINAEYEKQKTAIEGSIKAQKAGFDSLESMTRAFTDFLNGQAMGSNSTLNPMEKLDLAQNTFGGLLSKAQGGDLSVSQDLLRAADQLLSVGRDVYASSVSFAGLEGFVRSSVTGIAKQAGVTGLDASTPAGSMNAMAVNVAQSNAELIEQVKAMQDEMIRMRKTMESWRNQMAVAA